MLKLPKIIKCKSLPQWIISSDIAAYHKFSNTIYIRNDQNILVYLHEYLHWFFCLIKFDYGHKIIDK